MLHFVLLGRVCKWLRPFWPIVWIQSRFWYRREWPGREMALRNAFAHYKEIMSEGFLRMYFELGIEQAKSSLFPLAPRIAQPTLLAWGDQDHALNMGEGVKRLAKILPNARLHIFRGARHSLANEVPTELAARIHKFLEDHGKGPDNLAA
jgi:pimeloyl-ACP methyl ester carboxylesterase